MTELPLVLTQQDYSASAERHLLVLEREGKAVLLQIGHDETKNVAFLKALLRDVQAL